VLGPENTIEFVGFKLQEIFPVAHVTLWMLELTGWS
jgi:hypothetical protein